MAKFSIYLSVSIYPVLRFLGNPFSCEACSADEPLASITWASTSRRIYIGDEETGCVTLSDIFAVREGKEPLYREETENTWLLESNVHVQNNSRLELHGSGIGGDCDELRLISTSTTVVYLQAEGGTISLNRTRVVSWDTSTLPAGVDLDITPVSGVVGGPGRSYLSAISQAEESIGLSERFGQSRLDIINSEVAYLGSNSPEAYGLSWEVRGYTSEFGNTNISYTVNVYGDVIGSTIHHNAFGLYGLGLVGANWSYNIISDNIGAGMRLIKGSNDMILHNNTITKNGGDGISLMHQCRNASITGNFLQANNGTCVSLHDDCGNASITWNVCNGNSGDGSRVTGLELLNSSSAQIMDNLVHGYDYGVSLLSGSWSNKIFNNTIRTSGLSALYMRYDAEEATKNGASAVSDRPRNNVVFNNVFRTAGRGVTFLGSDFNFVTMNIFSDIGGLMFGDGSRVNLFRNNRISEEVLMTVNNGSCMRYASSFGRWCTAEEEALLNGTAFVPISDPEEVQL